MMRCCLTADYVLRLGHTGPASMLISYREDSGRWPPRKIRACMRVSAKIAPDWSPPVRPTRGPVVIPRFDFHTGKMTVQFCLPVRSAHSLHRSSAWKTSMGSAALTSGGQGRPSGRRDRASPSGCRRRRNSAASSTLSATGSGNTSTAGTTSTVSIAGNIDTTAGPNSVVTIGGTSDVILFVRRPRPRGQAQNRHLDVLGAADLRHRHGHRVRPARRVS
jgi:hypothetical protein